MKYDVEFLDFLLGSRHRDFRPNNAHHKKWLSNTLLSDSYLMRDSNLKKYIKHAKKILEAYGTRTYKHSVRTYSVFRKVEKKAVISNSYFSNSVDTKEFGM